MNKLTAFVAALLLVACSDAAPAGGPVGDNTSTPEHATTESSSTTSTDAPAPCASSAVDAGAPAPTGPQKTPSPVEHCEGAYLCFGWPDALWFGFDGTNCKFNGEYVFHADGTVTAASDGQEVGTWKGDYATFDFHGNGGYVVGSAKYSICTRIANQ
jgi:hypothetical protein